MENLLRMTIIFVWSMFFGFFSVMGFIDETMAGERKALILGGLLVGLGVYLAFEWFTRNSEPDFAMENVPAKNQEEEVLIKDEARSQLDERVLRRLKLYTKDNEQELQAALTPPTPRKRKNPALSSKR